MRVWEFILGMVAADFYRRFTFRGFIQWNSALAGLSLVAGVGLGAWAHGSSWPFLEWLTMAACGVSMIMLLAYSDKCGRGWRPMATTHWILCGEISYAIYLLHDGIQRYGRVAVEHITAVPIHALPAWTKISLIGISIVASFLSAIALWKYWEIPSRDWLRRTFC
jgi:peptidoglycan/LPS O-acetylase OafA/YrhL